MNYELAKKLKEAGYLRTGERNGKMIDKHGDGCFPFPIPEKVAIDLEYVYIPTLSELIEACGNTVFFNLIKCSNGWLATDHYYRGEGKTPEEAVANLWLALNANKPKPCTKI